jgi:hypothetical protein
MVELARLESKDGDELAGSTTTWMMIFPGLGTTRPLSSVVVGQVCSSYVAKCIFNIDWQISLKTATWKTSRDGG